MNSVKSQNRMKYCKRTNKDSTRPMFSNLVVSHNCCRSELFCSASTNSHLISNFERLSGKFTNISALKLYRSGIFSSVTSNLTARCWTPEYHNKIDESTSVQIIYLTNEAVRIELNILPARTWRQHAVISLKPLDTILSPFAIPVSSIDCIRASSVHQDQRLRVKAVTIVEFAR